MFPIAISAAEGEALCRWVRREQPLKTLEIGLAYAVSTLWICQGVISTGAHPVRHVAIDPFQHDGFSDVGIQLLKDAGVDDMVEHSPSRSEIELPARVSRGEQFDFAFVDGSHRFDAVFVDLFYLARLLRPSAVVFLDDYQLPSVARAASFYVNNLGWSIEEAGQSPDHHWLVLRTPADADDRPFGHFVDF